MLTYDPHQRTFAKDLIEDPYFMDVTMVKASQLDEVISKREEQLKRRGRDAFLEEISIF